MQHGTLKKKTQNQNIPQIGGCQLSREKPEATTLKQKKKQNKEPLVVLV